MAAQHSPILDDQAVRADGHGESGAGRWVVAAMKWTGTALLGLVLATMFFTAAKQVMPASVGDGSEYYAMEIAMATSHRPFMDERSWARYGELSQSEAIYGLYTEQELRGWFPGLRLGKTADFNHFWAYSGLAAATQAIVRPFGIDLDAHSSFLMLHALLFSAMVLLCHRWYGTRGLVVAVLLTVGSPILWLTAKVHTEFFTYCLTTIAVAAAFRRKWSICGLMLAIASMQNISFAIPAAISCLFCIAAQSKAPTEDHRFAYVLIALSAMAALLHPAYYFFRYGIVTPQFMAGGASLEGASAFRALNFLFDMDVGLLPNWPVGTVLAVASAIVLIRYWRSAPKAAALLVATYVAAALAAHGATQNMNSGATVHVSRYGLWYLCLFFPLFVFASKRLTERLPNAGSAVGVACAMLLISANWRPFNPNNSETATAPSPAAKFFYGHFPGMVDPNPEIFFERNSGLGEGARPKPSIVLGPGCRKALVFNAPRGAPVVLGSTQCGMSSEWIVAHARESGGWSGRRGTYRYFTISAKGVHDGAPLLRAGDVIKAGGVPSQARDFMVDGWSYPEPWGIWSDGDAPRLVARLEPALASRSLTFTMSVTGFFNGEHQEVTIIPVANGTALPPVRVSSRESIPKQVEINIPENVVRDGKGRLELTLQVDRPYSPKELGLSMDPRRLGFYLVQMSVR